MFSLKKGNGLLCVCCRQDKGWLNTARFGLDGKNRLITKERAENCDTLPCVAAEHPLVTGGLNAPQIET